MDVALPPPDARMLRAQLRAYQAWAADALRQAQSLREAGGTFEQLRHAAIDCELLHKRVDELEQRLQEMQELHLH